ncbi:Rid family hydrolase [Streptomyces avicenniae]|uniref:Rid family hydrolase n=1 Tax=Streptomyces avicenniae TaxID=500153 RepID=UPI00069A41C2|nr:Rid family hydrolase [Streptomyces avicenniae]
MSDTTLATPTGAGSGAPEFFVTPGYGANLLAGLRYSQAVRIGDRVETSGQGGWDPEWAPGGGPAFPEALEEEIVRAFDNVALTLAEAGATWRDVVAVNSYHVPSAADTIGEEHNRVMVEQFRLRMGDRAPIWTQTGVPVLGAPGMRVEIRVTAVVGHDG